MKTVAQLIRAVHKSMKDGTKMTVGQAATGIVVGFAEVGMILLLVWGFRNL